MLRDDKVKSQWTFHLVLLLQIKREVPVSPPHVNWYQDMASFLWLLLFLSYIIKKNPSKWALERKITEGDGWFKSSENVLIFALIHWSLNEKPHQVWMPVGLRAFRFLQLSLQPPIDLFQIFNRCSTIKAKILLNAQPHKRNHWKHDVGRTCRSTNTPCGLQQIKGQSTPTKSSLGTRANTTFRGFENGHWVW